MTALLVTSLPLLLPPPPPPPPPQFNQVDEILEIVQEIFYKMPRHENKEELLKLREQFVNGFLASALGHIEEIIGRNRHSDYAVGRSLGIADFSVLGIHLSFTSGYYDGLSAQTLHRYPNIRRIVAQTMQEPVVIPHLAPKDRPKIILT